MRKHLLFFVFLLPFLTLAQKVDLKDSAESSLFKLNTATEAAVIESDSLALVALYEATDGVNWTQNYNWLSGPVGSWYGVTTSGSRVQMLLLDNNNLVGSLPDEFGDLDYLYTLELQNNDINGSIPIAIGGLTGLNYLYLSSNNLSGSIPSTIGNLINLRYLSLNSNNLTGPIPSEIGTLTKLEQLYLNGNSIDGNIPSSIGNLTSLRNLGVNSNFLSGTIPSTIESLISLESFNFSKNEIDSIPPSMLNLTSLVSLWANTNFLTFEELYHLPLQIDYAPQNVIPIDETIYVNTGIPTEIRLPFDAAVTNSTYDWYRNSIFFATTTVNTLEITENTTATSSNYSASITNTDFPLLTIQTGNMIVISCEPSASEYNETACDSFTLNGVSYTESGTYIQNLANAAGCDSTLTLYLTINQSTEEELTVSACESYTLNGVSYTESGTYIQSLINDKGCEHILTLHLTINHKTEEVVTETACDSYTLNGVTYTSSGTFIQFLTNDDGCEHKLTLHLTISKSTSSELTETACNSFTLNDITYTESGDYEQVFTNAAGCDSTLILHLTINQSTEEELFVEACESYTYNGVSYTASGTYIQILENDKGCEHYLTIHLTILKSSSSEMEETACNSFSINGVSYSESGTYIQTLTNDAGCDSLLTLHLTIRNIDNTVTQDYISLTANATDAKYQWVDCGNAMEPMPGDTNQSFTATVNGEYAVIISKNGCESTSDCYAIISTNIGDVDFAKVLTIYPNPTNKNVTVDLGYYFTIINIQVKNLLGQNVFEQEHASAKKLEIELPNLKGVYFIQITADGKKATIRIIKE